MYKRQALVDLGLPPQPHRPDEGFALIGELLEHGFSPWIEDPEAVESALDLCAGSGCLAILMAHAFPNAAIDAIDISPDALVVASRNIAEYHLEGRVKAVESDLFAAVPGKRYDLIVCNPPYVTADAMAALPPEYRHEPSLAPVSYTHLTLPTSDLV